MSLLKIIRNLLIIAIFFGIVSAYIDYSRVIVGEKPVFCISTYNYDAHKESFRGLFYIVDRDVKYDPYERLEMSSNIKYRFLNQKLDITVPRTKVAKDYVLFVNKSLHCPLPSKLLVELEDKKVFIDCIDSIKYKTIKDKEYKDLGEVLKEKPKLLDTFINDLSFMGICNDKTTEIYKSLDDVFVNQTLYVYRCKGQVNDVYITTNPRKESNYCTIR